MRKSNSFCAMILVFALSQSLSIKALALGDSADGGCCGDLAKSLLAREPAMVQARGLDLYENLKRESHSRLVFLEALDESVCLELGDECRDLKPAIVLRLVKSARETLRQEAENSWQLWNYGMNAFNAALALAALVLSFFAFRTSRK